jgi:hypothetical protein
VHWLKTLSLVDKRKYISIGFAPLTNRPIEIFFVVDTYHYTEPPLQSDVKSVSFDDAVDFGIPPIENEDAKRGGCPGR